MKIAILGYGKMGKTIEKLAVPKGHEIVLKINHHNLSDLTTSNLQKADVAIEFSQPDSAFKNIVHCLEAGIPVVAGTTAWLDKLQDAKSICVQENGALLYASNFSIGVNIFFALNRYLAKMMALQPSYDVSMVEVHHTQKLDAPSGTAISLAEAVLEELPHKKTWVNKISQVPTELSILSQRIDHVPGTHQISYNSAVDTIEIKHTAHSREGFAAGAIMAAEWIIGKTGYFEMKDVLGL